MTSDAVHLSGTTTSVVVDLSGAGVPVISWWGPSLGPVGADELALLAGAVPNAGLDAEARCSLLPAAAAGWLGAPGIEGHRVGAGALAPTLLLGRWHLNDHHLGFTATDEANGLSVDGAVELAGPDGEVLLVRVGLTNTGSTPLVLSALLPTLPLPTDADELLTFDGRWTREWHEERAALRPGLPLVRESRQGRSGHELPSLLFAGSSGFGQHRGDVRGVHVAWSGNHLLRAERLADGRAYLQGGELLLPGEVVLEPGGRYEAPELVAVASEAGLNGASQALHRFIRSRPAHPHRPRPVTLNTWEAVYFDHDRATLLALADRAAAVGVERFVLDDGWFGSRRNDRSGLGDWDVDLGQHPDGLRDLAAHVRALGMEMGLWVEPEMVNPDSDLYRRHPDWVLGPPGDQQPLSRHQLVLDVARPEVEAYLLAHLDRLVTDLGLAYLKWDMNRPFTTGAHAQTVALYRLLDELRRAHPSLEVESCASGGGRIDLGILRRSERVWTSDSNDAIERQRIQRGATYLLPPELLGAHVGPPTAHTSGRRLSFGLRAITALPYHFGFEWNLLELDDRDLARVADLVALHRELRPVLHAGDVVRLEHPDPSLVAMAFVASDRGEAVVTVALLASSITSAPGALRIAGLDEARHYSVELVEPRPAPGPMKLAPSWTQPGASPAASSGRELALIGLPLPVMLPATALAIRLRAIG